MKIKRIVAYIIDYGIVYLISAILLMIPAFSFDQEKYLEYYEEYMNIPVEITEETMNKQYSLLYDYNKVYVLFCSIFIIFNFFIYKVINYVTCLTKYFPSLFAVHYTPFLSKNNTLPLF